MNFQGQTFNAVLDGPRLETQYARILAWMLDHGQYKTLGEIVMACGGTETAASARLRQYRKLDHGGYTVNSRRRGDQKRGLWEYQVLKPGFLL